MQIEKIRFFETKVEIPTQKYDLAFHGNNIDERGSWAVESISTQSSESLICLWDRLEMLISLGTGEDMRPHELCDVLRSKAPESILLESTTLGFVEILLLLDAFQEVETIKTIDILYVEPESYLEEESSVDKNSHSFALSEKLGQLMPIPGYTKNFVRRGFSTHLIAFLGFEKARLGRVLEDDEGAGISHFSVGIGVPAFVPGWENHTLSMNVDYFEDSRREAIYYLAANNPYSAYKLISDVHKSLDITERIILAPFGTKPAGIGAAIFAVSHKNDCGLIYDHPTHRDKRSMGIGKVHIYSCSK